MSFQVDLLTELLKKSDTIIDSKMPSAIDKAALKTLIDVLTKEQNNGKILVSDNVLAILEDVLYDKIKESAYTELAQSYLNLFNQADILISEEQAQVNNLKAKNIRELWYNSDNRKRFMQKVIYDLGSGGMKDIFVKGLVNMVRDINFSGLTVNQGVEAMSKFIIDDNYTSRYLRSTVFDALAQYDGAINQEVKLVYGFSKNIYIGNVKDNTRPVCYHLVEKLNGRFSDEQLKIVLDEYCPNGKPSDVSIEIEDRTLKKGSGMYEDTYVGNFMQKRGGYGCRHRCLSTR